MSRQREQFGPSDVAAVTFVSPFCELVKRLDGTWRFILRIDGEVTLPDGRRVRIDKHVGLEATDVIGRKPVRA